MQKLKHIHPVKKWMNLSTTTKAMSILVVVTLVAGGLLGWAQWQDAKNKEFLQQIAADFSTLQASLEEELGIEVENQSGCFTTSEKFNEGKTACYFRLERKNNDINIGRQLVERTSESAIFSNATPFSNTSGYSANYEDLLCVIAATPQTYSTFSVECPVGVRASNTDYVRELF